MLTTRRTFTVAATFAGLMGLAAPAWAQEAKPAGVSVAQPWARATPGGSKIGAAFLELKGGAADDKLVAAKSPVASVVELHDHIREGNIMKMRRVEAIPVPAGKSVVLKPGGLHVMLIDLKEPLKEGGEIDLTLTFEKAGEVKVKVPIQKVGAMGGPHGSGSGTDHGSGSGSGAKK